MTAQEQLEAVRNQLLDAYMAREDAEQKIKGLRNVLAGIQLGRTLAAEAASDDTDAAGA